MICHMTFSVYGQTKVQFNGTNYCTFSLEQSAMMLLSISSKQLMNINYFKLSDERLVKT